MLSMYSSSSTSQSVPGMLTLFMAMPLLRVIMWKNPKRRLNPRRGHFRGRELGRCHSTSKGHLLHGNGFDVDVRLHHGLCLLKRSLDKMGMGKLKRVLRGQAIILASLHV